MSSHKECRLGQEEMNRLKSSASDLAGKVLAITDINPGNQLEFLGVDTKTSQTVVVVVVVGPAAHVLLEHLESRVAKLKADGVSRMKVRGI